ncbi:MAG: acyl--CoA ligase [Lachnospiraceae bacterium]|jgi:long-chain acyl-CoA synthetase|nr:acyl--CoA ligase [Lachnospiraceae bacterium]
MHTGEIFWPMTIQNLPKNMYASLTETKKRLPNKTAIIDNFGRTYSYQDLQEKVQIFSTWLYQCKQVRKGQHVALLLYNSIEFCVAFLALNRLGAVVVPLPTKYKKEEILSLLEKSDVTLLISDETFVSYFDICKEKNISLLEVKDGEKGYGLAPCSVCDNKIDLRKIEQEIKASDLALLMFTSGTTSQSKGVLLTNENMMHAVVTYQKTLKISEEERAILPIPIYLITGLVAVFGLMLYVGGTVVLHKFFDARRVLEDIKNYQITFLHASPTVFTLLLEQREEYLTLPSLRIFACGSSNMPPGKIKMLKRWLPDCAFRTIYGLTETTSPATIFPTDANESPYIGSSGVPIPGIVFKIVNSDGEEVPDGEKGEVLVKGKNVTSSYYKIQNGAIIDGWLNTGDIGYFNEAGYLYLVDRKKDMINRGGEKICSFDVENELLSIEGVEDTAVVGILDELYGEVPVAVVKLQVAGSLTEAELKSRLKEKIAGYKVPVKIKMVDHIPMTENMKTDKKKIRELFQNQG